MDKFNEKHKSTQLHRMIIFFTVPFLVISVGFFIFYKYGNMSLSNKVALKDDSSTKISSTSNNVALKDYSSTKIFSNERALAALKSDGSIIAWGDEKYGGEGAPTDKELCKYIFN